MASFTDYVELFNRAVTLVKIARRGEYSVTSPLEDVMYEVWVTEMPKKELHTLERIFRKNDRTATDKMIFVRAEQVARGEATLLRGFHEEEVAERLAAEVKVHGGKAEVRPADEGA